MGIRVGTLPSLNLISVTPDLILTSAVGQTSLEGRPATSPGTAPFGPTQQFYNTSIFPFCQVIGLASAGGGEEIGEGSDSLLYFFQTVLEHRCESFFLCLLTDFTYWGAGKNEGFYLI